LISTEKPKKGIEMGTSLVEKKIVTGVEIQESEECSTEDGIRK
jgi:hypothetical protein